jgi:hypothetical protein
MSVAIWIWLLNKVKTADVIAGHIGIGCLVARMDNHTDFFDTRLDDLVDEDVQYRLFGTITIDQSLERQRPLFSRCGRNHGLSDFHGYSPVEIREGSS